MARTISGIVCTVKRGPNTVNGNSRKTVTLSTPTAGYPGTVELRVAPDSSIGQVIENAEYADRPHVFELNARDQITRSLGYAD